MIGAAVGIASSKASSDDQARRQEAAIKIQRQGAKVNFASVLDSSNIMKKANRDQTMNAMLEVLRDGAGKETEVKDALQVGASKLQASNEGLTSGRSKGRAMISLQVEGNKAIQTVESNTTTMLNQITDAQDKITNDINNQLYSAHMELQAILSNRGSTIDGTSKAIMAGVSGAATGASLGTSIDNMKTGGEA